MSAVTITSLGVSSTPASVQPCRFYTHSFRVEWDTAVAAISYPLNLLFYVNTVNDPNTTTKEINPGDQTGTDGTKLIFDVDFELIRSGVINSVLISNPTESQTDTTTFQTVSSWAIDTVIATTNIDELGTVSVTTIGGGEDSFPLSLKVSINDVDYFATNVITGISPGDYTLYVKDGFGCTKTEEFTINALPSFEALNDFKFISLLNPVPFTQINSLRPSFLNTPSYLVDTNSLSQNRNYEFLNIDVLRFQFRSNYEVNKAFLINCGEVFQELTVTQKSENLNQRDNRDAKFYFDTGNLYAYYDGTGFIYDNDGNQIGNNDLNGSLLFDQIQGELISVENLGVIEILEVVTVDGLGEVMKLNYTQPIAEEYLIITTFYNADNFEVYEFDINLSQPLDHYQIVVINNTTAQYDELNPLENASYISEVISIVDEFTQPNFKFVWKNSENNQISWDTGIECLNYLPKQIEPIYEPKDENEIYTTDTTTFMLESEVYDVFTFVFDVVSQITARQIALIGSSDYLKIDDNFYVKEETPEIEPNIGSNTYMVKLKLTLASNYNSNEREGLTRNANTVSTDGFLRIE